MLGFTKILPPVDFDKGVVRHEPKETGSESRALEILTIAVLAALLASGFLLRLWVYVFHRGML